MKRKIIGFCLFVLIILVSCNHADQVSEKVKLLFEYQAGHIDEDFEEEIEEKFNVDIVMSINNSSYPGYRFKEELTHNIGVDFFVGEFIKGIDENIMEEYLYNMAGESFINNYYLSTIEASTSSNGGLYYLPGPSYVYGIVYDKTAFEELGLEVPHNYSSFVELINKVDSMNLIGYEPKSNYDDSLEEVKIQAFVPTLKWSDMFQIIFNTMNYDKYLKGIKNNIWLKNYQNGTESMYPHMEGAANKYLSLFEDGVISLDMWNTKAPYRSSKLYEYHTSLMTIECQQGYEYNIEKNIDNPDNLHEMRMMPIYTSDDPDSSYLYAIPRSYFGATKNAMNNDKKREVLLDILNYLCSIEGQKLLINGEDYFGFLKGNNALDSSFYSDVKDTIESGRIINNFYYENNKQKSNVERYLHISTPDLVNGKISITDWLLGADEQRNLANKEETLNVYGTCKETLNPLQTAYLIGQAYLYKFNADIAYVPVTVNYGTLAYFYSGDITDEKIHDATTQNSYLSKAIEGDFNFVIVNITGYELLEYAKKSSIYGAAALAGVNMKVRKNEDGKVEYLKLEINGKELDLNKTYKVVTLKGAVYNAKIIDEFENYSFYDIFKSYIVDQLGGKVVAPKDLVFED